MTNNSHLNHCSTAALNSSWLIMSQQLFKTCFSILELLTIYQLLKNTLNLVIHRIQISWVR